LYVVCSLALAAVAATGVASCGRTQRSAERNHAAQLILIVLDTVRADHLSIYGYSRPTTPFLDSIAGDLQVFADVKSAATWTVPSHATMFTGLWPAEHGANWGSAFLRPEHATLAETLRAKGFYCAALSCNPIVSKAFGFAQGFDRFQMVQGPRAEKTANALADFPELLVKAAERKQRLFAFLNLMDAHIPFNDHKYGAEFGVVRGDPIQNHRMKWGVNAGKRPFTEEQQRRHVAAYDAAIRYLDDAVRNVFAMLAAGNMLEDSLIVITSDHGEGLGDHPEIAHEVGAWDDQLSVPLLIRRPHRARGGERIAARTSLAALMPALLDELGVARPAALAERPTLEGFPPDQVTAEYRSYFSETEISVNQETAANHPDLAARTRHAHVAYCGSSRLVVRDGGEISFYDLAADPTESHDLAADNPGAMGPCLAQYRALLAAKRFTPFAAILSSGRANDEDSRARRELMKSLGYLQ
jgi:arylsulfatase A-like enzyme